MLNSIKSFARGLWRILVFNPGDLVKHKDSGTIFKVIYGSQNYIEVRVIEPGSRSLLRKNDLWDFDNLDFSRLALLRYSTYKVI